MNEVYKMLLYGIYSQQIPVVKQTIIRKLCTTILATSLLLNNIIIIIIIMSVMQLGHLLAPSGLTYPEVFQRSNMIPSASWTVVIICI